MKLFSSLTIPINVVFLLRKAHAQLSVAPAGVNNVARSGRAGSSAFAAVQRSSASQSSGGVLSSAAAGGVMYSPRYVRTPGYPPVPQGVPAHWLPGDYQIPGRVIKSWWRPSYYPPNHGTAWWWHQSQQKPQVAPTRLPLPNEQFIPESATQNAESLKGFLDSLIAQQREALRRPLSLRCGCGGNHTSAEHNQFNSNSPAGYSMYPTGKFGIPGEPYEPDIGSTNERYPDFGEPVETTEYPSIDNTTPIIMNSTLNENLPGVEFPQQVFPQQELPQQGLPQQVFPQQVFPQQVSPQQELPQQGLPQQEYPQQQVPTMLPVISTPEPYPPNPCSGPATGPVASLMAPSRETLLEDMSASVIEAANHLPPERIPIALSKLSSRLAGLQPAI